MIFLEKISRRGAEGVSVKTKIFDLGSDPKKDVIINRRFNTHIFLSAVNELAKISETTDLLVDIEGEYKGEYFMVSVLDGKWSAVNRKNEEIQISSEDPMRFVKKLLKNRIEKEGYFTLIGSGTKIGSTAKVELDNGDSFAMNIRTSRRGMFKERGRYIIVSDLDAREEQYLIQNGWWNHLDTWFLTEEIL